MVALILAVFVHRRRAGPHKAHLAAQHVDKLRQLIDGGFPDEFAHLGNAGVILHFEHQTVHFVFGHQFFFAFLRIHVHAAEFIHCKIAAIQPHPALLKEQRSRTFQFQGNRHDRDDGNADDAAHKAARNVHQPFQRQVAHAVTHRFHRDHADAPHRNKSRGFPRRQAGAALHGFHFFQQRTVEMNVQTHAFHFCQIADQTVPCVVGNVDINFIQRIAPHPGHKLLVDGTHRHAFDLAADIRFGRVHQRHANDVFAPVPLQVPHQWFHAVLGGKHAHQFFDVRRVVAPQIVFQNRVAQTGERNVHRENAQIQVTGIQHRRLEHDEQKRQCGGQYGVILHHAEQFHFPSKAYNVGILIETGKSHHKRDHQHENKLQVIGSGVGRNAPQHGAEHQFDQNRAQSKSKQIHRKDQHVLQLLTVSHD